MQQEKNYKPNVSLFNDSNFPRTAKVTESSQKSGNDASLGALKTTLRNIKKVDNVSLQLQQKDIRDWLKTRYLKTKDFYVKTKGEM